MLGRPDRLAGQPVASSLQDLQQGAGDGRAQCWRDTREHDVQWLDVRLVVLSEVALSLDA